MKKEKLSSINEALSVLDSAIQEGSDEIKEIIMSDYHNIKNIMAGAAPNIFASLKGIKEKSLESMSHTKDSMVDYSTKTVKNIDRSVHQNPWSFIAGVTLSSMIFGYWMGRKGKNYKES